MNELRTGPWNLTELANVKKLGLNVFSIFSCGGGSTMGYKLAGYDVIGCCEIDPQMLAIYRKNHNPRFPFLMGVQQFKNLPDADLPPDLFNLDILDGSPPCSSFSMAGSREKKWGVKKKFREGQAEQVLDDLFFDFIDVAKRLQPKVVVAENVKGLIQGNARGYVKQIFQAFREAGYSCQLFLLNSASMGVPQRRERTFFIANRLGKKISLEFNETPISFRQATTDLICKNPKPLTPTAEKYWRSCKPGKSFSSVHAKGSLFNWVKIDIDQPINTLAGGNAEIVFHGKEPRVLTEQEWIRCQSFPEDYDFMTAKAKYVCGMSVPPFMMQRIADQIYKQFFAEVQH